MKNIAPENMYDWPTPGLYRVVRSQLELVVGSQCILTPNEPLIVIGPYTGVLRNTLSFVLCHQGLGACMNGSINLFAERIEDSE